MRIQKLLTIILSFLFYFSYAQKKSSDDLKPHLQNGKFSIFSAQKLLLSKQKTSASGKLAKAVFCQLKANQLYKAGDFEKALCYTIAARALSNEIIVSTGSDLNPTYKLSAEEEKMKSECSNTTDFFISARNLRKDLPETDSYFINMENLLNSGINENY
jgi:hypothetical protein